MIEFKSSSSATHTDKIRIEESLSAVVDAVDSAMRESRRFIIVTRDGDNMGGKKLTVRADLVLEVYEL